MAEKKRQHYVPKFLFRIFSINQDDKLINIYHIENDKFILSVPLKEQASIDYFYGKDGVVEDSFAQVEGVASPIIKEIINSEKLPPFHSKAHSTILFFTLSLGARTLFKAKEQVEFINKFVKKIASHEQGLKGHLNDFDIKVNNPISLSLKAVAETFPLASDLHFKLIINKTDLPFVISDNPVVFYNQFLEERKKYGSNIGIAVKGLQIFLPISPNHILKFYDHTVYKIGSSKSNLVEVNNPDDISTINGLQYLNANITLYFNDRISQKDISAIKTKFNKYRSVNKVNIKE